MTFIHQTKTNEETNPIDAISAKTGLSKNYKHCNSQNVIDFIESKGFKHVGTSFGNPRKEEKRGFQKHLMIFENENFRVDDDNILQLLITNSHDGSTSLKMNIGVYRAICANGLVAGDTFFSNRVIHLGGDFLNKVNHGLGEAIELMPIVASKITTMKNRMLTSEEIDKFRMFAIRERLKGKTLSSVFTGQVDRVRREADQGTDLYTVLNRIQESTIRGGVQYSFWATQEKNGQTEKVLRQNKTREIKSITQKMKLNQNLFDYAAKLVA